MVVCLSVTNGGIGTIARQKCEQALCEMLCETVLSYKAVECNGMVLSSTVCECIIILSTLITG